MKALNIFLASFLLIGLNLNAQFRSGSLQAAGLTCAMCTKAINESLKQLEFVESIKPDIKNSVFLIQFKQNSKVDPDKLMKAVEEAGFSVAKLKLTGNFQNIKVSKDAHVSIEGSNYHFLNVGNQTLDGEKTITLVDKQFLSAKEFKKYAMATKMSCVQTGKAATCCVRDGVEANSRIFHVTI